MKTRIISIILVVTLFFSTTLSAYADTKQDDFNEAYSIPDLVKNEKYIKGEEQNGNCVIESESLFVSIPINTDDLISIEVKDDEKSPALRMMIPNSVFTSKGRINENGCVEYFSKDESSALYVGVLSDDNKICDSVCSLITIKNANAPKQYKFSFDLPEGYSIVERSYYFNNYASEEEIEALGIESSEQILFILDDNKEIINTIEAPWAVDADGNIVYTEFKIDGNTITQIVEFNENSKFPIVADPTSHPAITKYNYITLEKANNGATLAKRARRKINERQNSTLSTFLNVMTTIISFIPIVNIVVSYTNSLITAVQGGVSSNLERQEDEYTLIYETFTGTSATEKKVVKAQFKLPVVGRWQGNSRGYVYTQKNETLKFFDKNGNEVNIS